MAKLGPGHASCSEAWPVVGDASGLEEVSVAPRSRSMRGREQQRGAEARH